MRISLASHAGNPSPWHELIGPLTSARLQSQHDGQSELNGESVASRRAPSRTIPHPFTQLPLPKGVEPRLLAPSIKLEKEEFFARAPTDWSSLAERHPYLQENGIQLVQLLGRGGQGDVYLGWDHERKEAVAVKYAAGFSNKKKGFQAEKEVTEAVTGVRVPRILDYLSTQNAEYLVLSPYLRKEKSEILPGTLSGAPSLKVALKEAFKRGPSLSTLRDLLPTLMEIAQLVERVHEQGVLHRDLRPQNILISRSRPVLIDFGNGAFLDDSQKYDGAELSKGTPGYVAPEYLKATSGCLTEKGDIYAFGVILYEALTGRVPFPAGKPAHVIHFSVCTRTPPAPHEINPIVPISISQLCMQCLAPDPSERPRSAGVVGRVLRAVA